MSKDKKKLIKERKERKRIMKAEVMTVTPGMAREFLKRNTCNRTIKKDVVCKYANDMKNGLWKLGG